MFEALKELGFEILALHHAEAILTVDMPEAERELAAALSSINIPIEELVRGGGGEGKMTQRLRRALADSGWHKHNFDIRKIVDGEEKESTSHESDRLHRDGPMSLSPISSEKQPRIGANSRIGSVAALATRARCC